MQKVYAWWRGAAQRWQQFSTWRRVAAVVGIALGAPIFLGAAVFIGVIAVLCATVELVSGEKM